MKLYELARAIALAPVPHNPTIELWWGKEYLCDTKPGSDVIRVYGDREVHYAAPKGRDLMVIKLKEGEG